MFVSVRELKHTPALEIPINSATVRIRKVNILVADVEESLCRPSVDRSGRISDERVVPDVHVLLLSTVYEDVMNPYVRRIEPLGEIREVVDVQMDHVGKFPRCHFHEFTQRIPYCRPAAYLLEALPGNAVDGGITDAESVVGTIYDIYLGNQLPAFERRSVERILLGREYGHCNTDKYDKPQKQPFTDSQQRYCPILPLYFLVVVYHHIFSSCLVLQNLPVRRPVSLAGRTW